MPGTTKSNEHNDIADDSQTIFARLQILLIEDFTGDINQGKWNEESNPVKGWHPELVICNYTSGKQDSKPNGRI